MSEFFAEATVRLQPDLTGFITQLRTQLKSAIDALEAGDRAPKVRVKPALTRDFVGDLRKQVNTAITQAQTGIKPIQVRAVLSDVSTAQIAREVGRATQTVRAQAPAGAAPQAVAGTTAFTGATREAEAATLGLAKGLAFENQLLAQGARILGVSAAAEQNLTKEKVKAVAGDEKLSRSMQKVIAAEEALAAARATSAAAPTVRRRFITSAESAVAAAEARREPGEAAQVDPRIAQIRKELTELTAVTERRTATVRRATPVVIAATAAERELGRAQVSLKTSEQPLLSIERRLAALREAASRGARTLALAEIDVAEARSFSAIAAARATQAAATGVVADAERQIRAEKEARDRLNQSVNAQNKSLRENQREASKSARSQEQLRRGVASTGLSFLGIRGATLAASASFLAGAAALSVFAKALQSASEFNDQINVFRATAGATAEEMDRVRDAARALGADITLPGVSAADAAESMTELAKAGLDVQESIDGARGVLQLATAAAISNAQAVELAANALNAFQLQGSDATRVADTFANAANAAQGSIVDIGIAFQQSAAAGRQVGLSFEDTATFLTILARNGLRGSDAGTSLRTALLRLIRPTEAARDRLRELGIEVRDAAGNLRPEVFQQISTSLSGLSPAARDATIALIGGQDAFRAISILGRQSIDDLVSLRAELRTQGTAADLAAARTEGLRGSLEALSNTLSTLGVRIGSALTPAIQSVVGGFTTFAAGLAASEGHAQAFSGVVSFLETALAGLGATLTALAPAFQLFIGAQLQIVNAIGVPTILAAIAAFKLFPAVVNRATGAVVGFRSSLAALQATAAITATATARASAGLSFSQAAPAITRTQTLRAALSGLAGSLNLVQLGITAAAVGLFVLISRESAAERATRQLRASFDELADSMGDVRASSDALFSARRGAQTADAAVSAAIIAQREAQAALSGTQAPRGSLEFVRLQNSLRVATQNVTFAVQDQRRALEELNRAQEEQFASRERLNTARQEAVQRLNERLTDVQSSSRIFGFRGANPGEVAAINERRARERLLEVLGKESDLLRESEDANERAIGSRLAILGQLIKRVNDVPSLKEINFLVRTESLDRVLSTLAPRFGLEGDRAGALFAQRVRSALQRGVSIDVAVRNAVSDVRAIMGAAGDGSGDAFTRAAAAAITATGDRVVNAVTQLGQRLRSQMAGLQREALDISIAGGSDAQVLANLREQEAVARAEVSRQETRRRQGKVSFEAVTAAKEELDRILSQIRSIQDQMAADTKAAADDAKQKAEERDQNLLDALGFNRDRAQERIIDAQAKAGLQDDIRRTRELRQLVLKQIETIGDRVKNAKLRQQAIRELGRIQRDLRRDIRELQRQRQEEIRERAAERNQLDIEFAQLTENRAGEIRARQREIARLKRLQSHTRRGTLEYRRLRNLIAEQEQAIKDLKDQQEQKNDSFKQLAFAFLQAQQGFAANLIGNLIPGGAVGGLVGVPGGQPISKGRDVTRDTSALQNIPGLRGFGGGLAQSLVQEKRTRDAVGAVQPVTSGQGNVQIDLLRKIWIEVRKSNRGSDHPEAKQQRKTGATAMDYGGGGASSMGM